MEAGKKHSVKPFDLFSKRPHHKIKSRYDAGAYKPSFNVSFDYESDSESDNEEDEMISDNGLSAILVLVILGVGVFLLWKQFMAKDGLATLGSGGTSGLVPNTPLFPNQIHDNPDYNLGHGLAYGIYNYDIFSKTGREKQNTKIDEWMEEDIEIDEKYQKLQIPTIPGHPAGGGTWLLNKDWVGDFDKKLGVAEIGGGQVPMKSSDKVRNEYVQSNQYDALRNRMKSGDYILSKINNQFVEKKNMQGSKSNPHIERMKEEIESSNELSGSKMMDIALKRDSSIQA